ncbi:MAG: hypothetical protein SVV03_00390 [Candidatus Nanohaloarchaea archaeon]|nr:hypothetical protein [Candidatus Nanohaloarchaea archaeon]
MGIEKEPSEGQREDFKDLEILGDISVEEFSGIDSKLSSGESVEIIAGVGMENKGKKIVVVTNHRLLSYSSKDVSLLGEKKQFRDIKLGDIREMDVEDRKDFDILFVETSNDEIKLMLPDKAGVKISGVIRRLQESTDPFDDLERLKGQREKENITEEEFQEKKNELLERV